MHSTSTSFFDTLTVRSLDCESNGVQVFVTGNGFTLLMTCAEARGLATCLVALADKIEQGKEAAAEFNAAEGIAA